MELLIGILPLFLMALYLVVRGMQRQAAHADLISKFSSIQKKRKSRVIAMVHRQEAMGILGVPILKYIDLNDAEDILEAIRRTSDTTPLEIVLHTPGGLVLPALQIARAIKAHPARTTVFVPHYAMSGGTLIALAADEIVMSQHAVLGPVDPQIGGLPAASLLRLKQEKSIDMIGDQTLILADVGEMAIRQLHDAAYELLSGTVSDNAAHAIAEQLSSGRWTHDYPIIPGHAAELGLNVSVQMPKEIMQMMALFPSSLSGSTVKAVDPDQERGSKGKSQMPVTPVQAPYARPLSIDQGTMTGYQPGPGARSHSYGPWNPRALTPPEQGQGQGQGQGQRHGQEQGRNQGSSDVGNRQPGSHSGSPSTPQPAPQPVPNFGPGTAPGPAPGEVRNSGEKSTSRNRTWFRR